MACYSPVQAQTNSKDDFEKVIVQEFCDTFAKQSARLTMENMSEELGMMLLPLFSKYSEQIETFWGLASNDMEGAGVVGEKIGQLATINCPAFQTFIKANLKEINEQRETGAAKKFSGKILRIEGKPFT